MDRRVDRNDRQRRERSPRQLRSEDQTRGRWGDAPAVPEPAQPKLVDEDFIYAPKSGQYYEHDDRSVWRPSKRAKPAGDIPLQFCNCREMFSLLRIYMRQRS